MPLDTRTHHQTLRLLAAEDDSGGKGARQIEDAHRLWARVGRFLEMNLVAADVDLEALELACYALQFPSRANKPSPARRGGPIGLRERSEQAAELLINLLAPHATEELLDRASRILRETPHRSPVLDESKLLADAVNLDDFGATGAALAAMQSGRQNTGLKQFLQGFARREEYGYWEARLKEGFHFGPVRELARARVETARQATELLARELKEDRTL